MSQPSSELLHVAGLMREALATCILPWFGKLSADQIGMKGPEDFVTIADTSAESFLGERLRAFHPGSRIIGEEGVSADPTLLSTLADGACWIIDPVDGTWLFKNNQPHFGTLVSRSQDGVTQAGWILETYLDETGGLQNRIIMGDRESGVWISNTNHASFIPLPSFATSDLIAGIFDAQDFTAGFVRGDLDIRSSTFAWSNRLYSSASIYSAMLRGEIVTHFASGCYPWDHSAGTFLVQLQGGVAQHLTLDRPYNPDRLGTGIAVAINEQIYRNSLSDIFAPFKDWPARDPDIRKSN